MDSSTLDNKSGVESRLIDLSQVPLTALRKLDGAALRQSLQHVLEKTRRPQVASAVEHTEHSD